MNVPRLLAAVASALVLAACGGGGGGIGGTGGGGGGGGIGGTGVAYGTITGFGSVWVNGVRYETPAGTVFRLDDSVVSQSDLKVGMVARVEGSGTTASTVVVDSALKGRVEAVAGDVFTVMGQTVQTDATTTFDNGVRPVTGDYVEVHGLPQQAGVVAASHIERKATPASPPFVVTGFVSTHDTAARTFTVGGLSVAYGSADTGDMPSSGWVGLLVEAKGSHCAGTPVCGTLTAAKVKPAGPRIASSPKTEIEGYVTALTADGFVLGGQRVVLTASTKVSGGVRADIVVGVKVEAEGPITDGVMTATDVELKDSVRIEADVLSVEGDRVRFAGLPGIEVQVTSSTELDDLPSLAALQPGDHVRVKARFASGGLAVASELELRSADADVELRGPVSAFADPRFTLLGLEIDTSGFADSAFRDDDVVIGRSAFFAALSAGRVVKASGSRSGDAVAWSRFELED
ncbi:MAG: hypothetical protein Fur0014_02520 [Rubrivivax sp.]